MYIAVKCEIKSNLLNLNLNRRYIPALKTTPFLLRNRIEKSLRNPKENYGSDTGWHLLCGDVDLPVEKETLNRKFIISADDEMNLRHSIFQFARDIMTYKLTEQEIALLSAIVLLSPGKFIITLGSYIVQWNPDNTTTHRTSGRVTGWLRS
jgi:hypothetical protein